MLREVTQPGDIRQISIVEDHGLRVDIVDIGASIAAIHVPASAGYENVVVSGLSASEYKSNANYCGSTIGRYANRIANARFELDGTTYQLQRNDGTGKHSLHAGSGGFHAQRFSVVDCDARSAVMAYRSPDGEEGFPGDVDVSVSYRVTGLTLTVDFVATTSKSTPINLTNHSYFNLAGDAHSETMLRQELAIAAGRYTPVDAEGIPTGEVSSLDGSRLDLRAAHKIGDMIGEGIDHNYVTDPSDRDAVAVATLYSPDSGVRMQLFTSMPGLQVYTADFAQPPMDQRSAIALEPQYFPDSPNQNGFPSTILRPGETWRETIEYRFAVD